jgi:hypothetical protein
MTARAALQRALERGYILGLLAFVVYAWLASPLIVGNDNAEFSTLAVTGGIAHPSGYPLYVLWLRATSWLPGATPAHTAAIATAILSATSLVVLHAACRAWGARPTAATIAVAVFASSGLMLRVNTEAEVFPLNDLAVATVLWLAAANGPLRGIRRAAVLGLVAGLGLSNHLTCALVAPVGVLGVIRGAREARVAAAIVAAVAGVVAGMLPYLYLFVAPTNIVSWMHPAGLHDAVDIFLRKTYGGAIGFTGANASVDFGAQLVELVVTLARAWQWVLLPVGVGMLGYRVVRAVGEPRAGWITLLVSFVLAGPILITRFDIQPIRMGLYVVHRFHILPALLLVIPVASGLDRAGALLVRRLGDRPSVSRYAAALPLVGFVALIATSLPELARFHSPAMENGVRGMLLGLPENAIVFTTTDELDISLRYEQMARGERPDVLVFRPRGTGARWYADRVRALGFDLGVPESTTGIAERALATGRPLFVNRNEKEILAAFPSYPFGLFERVLPRGNAIPSIADIVAKNRALFSTFELDYPTPGWADEYAMSMHTRLASTWSRLGAALAAGGDRDGANDCYLLAQQLSPRDDDGKATK